MEWAHLVADNRLAELAEMNEGGLTDILRDLDEPEGFRHGLGGLRCGGAG